MLKGTDTKIENSFQPLKASQNFQYFEKKADLFEKKPFVEKKPFLA